VIDTDVVLGTDSSSLDQVRGVLFASSNHDHVSFDSVSTQSIKSALARRGRDGSPVDALNELYEVGDIQRRVDAAIRLAATLGLPVLVAGAGVFHLGTQLASSLCSQSYVVADVPIGLLEPSGPAGALSGSDVDAILIRNANLSDLGVYACDLLSLIFQRASDKRVISKSVAVIITAATGPAALPVPDEIGQLAVKIELATMENKLTGDTASSQEVVRGPFGRRLATKLDELESSDLSVSPSAADLHKLMNADFATTDDQLQRV
jgi:hypothetical protein